MLLSEIVKIRSIQLGKGDDLVFQELLKSEIIAFNSLLIKQNYERFPQAQRIYIQTIKCIELEKISIGDNLDEFVLRTKQKLPKSLPLKKKEPFFLVSNSINGKNKKSISYLTPDELEYIRYRRFTSNELFYTYEENDYIYIHNTLQLEKISVQNIFDNPFDVVIFANEHCTCNHESECIIDNDLFITDYNAGLILSSFGRNNENQE